jgi:hypothetical protein
VTTGKDRPVLCAVDGREDAVVRRHRFEQAHPEAVILPPCAGRWRAVAAGRTLGAWDLGDLMDQLDAIYPDGGTGTAVPARRPGERLR